MSDQANAAKRPSGLRACADGLDANPDKEFAKKCMRHAADRMEELETELAAAREEIKELNDKLDDAVADATNAVNDIIRMKWRRDRLAVAFNDAAELFAEIMRDEVNHQDEAEKWLRAYAPQHLFPANSQAQERDSEERRER